MLSSEATRSTGALRAGASDQTGHLRHSEQHLRAFRTKRIFPIESDWDGGTRMVELFDALPEALEIRPYSLCVEILRRKRNILPRIVLYELLDSGLPRPMLIFSERRLG